MTCMIVNNQTLQTSFTFFLVGTVSLGATDRILSDSVGLDPFVEADCGGEFPFNSPPATRREGDRHC